jgi:transcriptional regulator with XRE-family HTH domain
MQVARNNRNLTQEELGRDPDVRIAQYFISLLELGKGIPTPDQRLRLARRLGLHPDDLLKPVVLAGEQEATATR